MTLMRLPRPVLLMSFAAIFSTVLTGCGGGGGGGGTAAEQGTGDVILTGLEFIDPSSQTHSRIHAGPGNTSLVQRIRLDFSGSVSLSFIDDESLYVRERGTHYKVVGSVVRKKDGRRLIFTPRLPTMEPVPDAHTWHVDSGLRPGTEYELVIPLGSPDAIPNLKGIAPSLAERYGEGLGVFIVRFETTEDPGLFWAGLEPQAPQFLSSVPEQGASDQPLHLFSDKTFESYALHFDAPIDPESSNLEGIRLLDRQEGRELAAKVWIEDNTLESSIVRVLPSGILPPSRELAIEVPVDLRGLAGGSDPGSGRRAVTAFNTRSLGDKVADHLAETYADSYWEERQVDEFDTGLMPADWDREDSNHLEAALEFPGQGELGRFIPFPDEANSIIVLNTDSQEFPLVDGSTPDARRGTVVDGGVFNFTEIIIPEGIIIRGEGSNPLVLSATEGITLNGAIDVTGHVGEFEWAKDQSLVPLRGGFGGPGGGRGGDGHPARFDGDFVLVSPRTGDPGEGARMSPWIGGRPGLSGINTDPDEGQNCVSGRSVARAGGGGGGSYGALGEDGLAGGEREDVTSAERLDANGNLIWEPLEDAIAYGGASGDAVFRDENPDNDFIGRRGEISFLLAGQGGGGGGTRLDNYWCAELFPGLPPVVADARGGGGGGGGGALALLSMVDIHLGPDGRIFAMGGDGGGGEPDGKAVRGGGGGGGSGGLVRIMTAGDIIADEGGLPFTIDVNGGIGAGIANYCRGGNGGAGVVQLQVPPGALFDPFDVRVLPPEALVDVELVPSELVSSSVGQSRWINLGVGVYEGGRGAPEFDFKGTDDQGFVIVDGDGRIPDPDESDIRVDTLAVIDPLNGRIIISGQKDTLPDNARVRIEFQSAMPLSSGTDEVDPKSISPWSPTIDVADGRQLIRFRVTMDIAVDGYALSPFLPKVAVRLTRLRFDF